MSALLEVDGVSKHFGGVKAVDEVSFEVERGASVGVLGPNGAGKTTMFDLVAGRHRLSAGRVAFEGKPISNHSPDRRCKLGIARTFQLIQAFESMTVFENVMVGAMVRNWRRIEAEQAAEEAIERTGLGEVADRPPSELSTIDGKRLELARALATRPTLLLLDEISNGLRNDELQPLRDLIGSIRSDRVTLLVIEHNVRFLAAVCEWTIAMDGGRKLTEGPPEDVLRDPRVVETYLGRRRAA